VSMAAIPVVAVVPGAAEVLGSWRPAPVADVLVFAASVGYGLLVSRTDAWPRLRSAAWAGAVAVLVLALNGPVAVFGDVLFWVHMIQHLLLIMVVPMLVIWAQPVRLVRSVWAGPDRLAAWWTGLRVAPAARGVTSPIVALAGYAGVVMLTHLTGFQQIALAHPAVRAVETVLYLVSGYLLFLPVVGADIGPFARKQAPPHLLRLAFLALAMGVDTLTGVALMLTQQVLAPGYAATHPEWGPSALADQNVAGAVMWWGGDALMMVLAIIIGIQWGLAPPSEQGFGTWIEEVRRRAVLGDGPGGATGGEADDVDADEDALAAYNRRLAALHEAGEERGSAK
jgi:putative membrane protein